MADDNNGVIQTADNQSLSDQAAQILAKQRQDVQERYPDQAQAAPLPRPRPADAPQPQQPPQQAQQAQQPATPGPLGGTQGPLGLPSGETFTTTLQGLAKWLTHPFTVFDSMIQGKNDPTAPLKAPSAQQIISAGGESGSGASPDTSPYTGTPMGPRNPNETAFAPGPGGKVTTGENTPDQAWSPKSVQTVPGGKPSPQAIPGAAQPAQGTTNLPPGQSPGKVAQGPVYNGPSKAPPIDPKTGQPGKPQGPSGPMWIPRHVGTGGGIVQIEKENVEPGSQEQHWQKHAQDASHLPPKFQPEWMNQRYHDEMEEERARLTGQARADSLDRRTQAQYDLGMAKLDNLQKWQKVEADLKAAQLDKLMSPMDKFITETTLQNMKNQGLGAPGQDLGAILEQAERAGLSQQGSSALQMVLSQNARTMQQQEEYNQWLRANPTAANKASYDRYMGRQGAADEILRAPNPMVATPPPAAGPLQGGTPGSLQ